MQIQSIEDRINSFLEKKFRYSRSYATKATYATALKKFQEFLGVKYNLDINQAILQFETKTLDPIVILDELYTYLSTYQRKDGKIGYGNSAITTTIVVTKEFLNSQNLHIYNEDIKQRFRLPKKQAVFEEGLTKEILVRLLHNSSPKLQTAILMCASSGMRIGELIQLKISDIDFGTNPTTIHLRKETTKTRDSRFTCISTEASNSLKDYLRKKFGWTETSKDDKYIFLNNEHDYTQPDNYNRKRSSTECTLVQALLQVVKSVPELSMKNENGRNNIHFHAFRAWFKTQVTNAHQSDFAEALMGHKSIKLVYFRQNAKDRLKTYLEVEPALTISDFARFESSMEDLKAELASMKIEIEKQRQRLEVAEKYQKIEN
jgi:integrase